MSFIKDLALYDLDDLNLINKSNWIPKSILRSFGCYHCSWRNNPIKCQNSVLGSDCNQFEVPTGGICRRRLLWLLSLVPDYDSKPSFDRIHRDININLGRCHMEGYQEQEEFFHKKLTELESNKTMDEKEKLKMTTIYDSMANNSFKKWVSMWKVLAQVTDNQVGRETTKKVEMTKSDNVRMSEITNIVRGNTLIEVDED